MVRPPGVSASGRFRARCDGGSAGSSTEISLDRPDQETLDAARKTIRFATNPYRKAIVEPTKILNDDRLRFEWPARAREARARELAASWLVEEFAFDHWSKRTRFSRRQAVYKFSRALRFQPYRNGREWYLAIAPLAPAQERHLPTSAPGAIGVALTLRQLFHRRTMEECYPPHPPLPAYEVMASEIAGVCETFHNVVSIIRNQDPSQNFDIPTRAVEECRREARRLAATAEEIAISKLPAMTTTTAAILDQLEALKQTACDFVALAADVGGSIRGLHLSGFLAAAGISELETRKEGITAAMLRLDALEQPPRVPELTAPRR